MKRALYYSSSVGLGHVTRDYRLSMELRRRGFDITWITAGPALTYLQARGERVHPVSFTLRDLGGCFERMFKGGRLSPGIRDALGLYSCFRHNSEELGRAGLGNYDVVIADEGWELLSLDLSAPLAFITDIEGFGGAFGRLGRYAVNKINSWFRDRVKRAGLRIYVGLQPTSTGLFRFYGQLYTHTGSYPAPSEDDGVVITIGGTGVGSDFMRRAMKEVDGLIPLVPGAEGWESPLERMAKARALITMAGYGTLIEASAMRKRAIIAYPENDFEQEANASLFSSRRGYRVVKLSGRDSLQALLKEVLEERPDPPAFTDAAEAIASEIESYA